jgi:hypothetical protein
VSLEPRQAVYALARTQLDWIPATSRPAAANTAGFAHGRDDRGRQLRWLTCPDCLANGFTSTGCETCRGAGEVPDAGRDPYETRAEGAAGFYGEEFRRRQDRARWLDAKLADLERMARMRDGVDEPEDWLTRALRVKADQWRHGDYQLLHEAQERLSMAKPMRHLAWVTFVVEQQPLSIASAARVRLDETADALASWMLGAIACMRVDQQRSHDRLGARRARLRPEGIVVPVELERQLADAQAGKGRWANGHTQGQRRAVIAGMRADGHTAGEIARRVGLTKRRVQQILADLAAQGAATGPAA